MDQHGGGSTSRSATGQVAVALQSLNQLLAELLSGDEARAEAAVEALVAAGESAVAGLCRTAALRRMPISAGGQSERSRRSSELKSSGSCQALDDPVAEVRAAGALALAAHPDPARGRAAHTVS